MAVEEGNVDAQHPLAVITPTLDGDVLTHLALTEMAFTPGQLSRLLPKGSVEGTRKVLHRLAKQGIVVATRAGDAATTYELNRDHLAADAVVALANQARMLRQRIEKLVASWEEPPVYVALFGSWARGQATVESDVDVLLVQPDDADGAQWDSQLDALQQAVSRWTGNDARPFVIDESDLPHRRTEPVLQSIRSEGVTLYGDAAWFRTQVKPRRLARRAEGPE